MKVVSDAFLFLLLWGFVVWQRADESLIVWSWWRQLIWLQVYTEHSVPA